MRGGFRIRKKRLKQAGWQFVGERKEADGEYQVMLQKSDGEKVTAKGSTRAKAYAHAARDLLGKVEA
jgi:dsRNA-specific ribonuclease